MTCVVMLEKTIGRAVRATRFGFANDACPGEFLNFLFCHEPAREGREVSPLVFPFFAAGGRGGAPGHLHLHARNLPIWSNVVD